MESDQRQPKPATVDGLLATVPEPQPAALEQLRLCHAEDEKLRKG